MLLDNREDSSSRQVAVAGRNPLLRDLLGEIFAEWGFSLVAVDRNPEVIFVEYGLPEPAGASRIIWLTPLPRDDGASLLVPLSLTRLYHLLESELYPSPRRHIRTGINLSVELKLDGRWYQGRLISLSDRGGRLVFEQTLPSRQELTLEIRLGRQLLRQPCTVLYSIPAGDTPGRQQPQLGLLFKPVTTETCQTIRQYIEHLCLERALSRLGLDPQHPVTSWFDLGGTP
ncbi:MAG: PilZ domain-containing protein [Desulfuromonadales bacterium]|nr:PilZ domain-containing protein [Desulfuromonadales bacterium]